MIASWRDAGLKNWFERDIYSKRIPADLRDRLFRKLQLLDDATTEADLLIPPNNRFEHLGGKLNAFCSIRVNQRWRLVFRWSNGEAHDVYLDDHSYR
jgi:proteic killer suppression protein